MARGELVVGLDIGTTKVCTLVAEVLEDGSLSAIGFGLAPSSGLRRGAVVDLDATSDAIRKSVDEAQKSAGAEIRSAIVGITGDHIASQNARGVVAVNSHDRNVSHDDVQRVLESARLIVLPPDREIVHAIPRSYSLDGLSGIRNPVGMYGARLEVESHIITGITTFIKNIGACVERAGLGVDEFVLEPVATARAVLPDAERELGAAVVDIGGGTADVAVFRAGEIHATAIVPMGGTYITRDIATCLRTSLDEAERIKRSFGCARRIDASLIETFAYQPLGESGMEEFPTADLAEIIEARAAEMLELVRQELARVNASQPPAGIVFSGGGALLPGLSNLASDILAVPARVARPRIGGPMASTLSEPPFATAIGLVQWGAAQAVGRGGENPAERFLGGLRRWIKRWLDSGR